MTDWKSLCAELAEDLSLWLEYDGPPSRLPIEEDESYRLLKRARAALVETEPDLRTNQVSPEAHAVLAAAQNLDYGNRRAIAAVLRAAARLAQASAHHASPSTKGSALYPSIWGKGWVEGVRDAAKGLLAIAAELDGTNTSTGDFDD